MEKGYHDFKAVTGRKKVTVIGAGNVGTTAAQEIARREDMRRGRARGARADDRDLPSHHAATSASSFPMTASATSLVPTAVGSSRFGFMS